MRWSLALGLCVVVVFTTLWSLAWAEARYKIEGRVVVPPVGGDIPALEVEPIRVMLNGGLHTAIVRSDGMFTIHDVAAGTFLLEVVSTRHVYPPVRLEVSINRSGKVRAHRLNDRMTVGYPLVLEPEGVADFFEKRQAFNFLAMFKSPMVIMMMVTLVFMFIMPRMIESDSYKEMQREMQQQNQEKTEHDHMLEAFTASLVKDTTTGRGRGVRHR